ncbi:hypothetical protein AB0G02_34820, partial [Actinosynnema sp. NPDC023658]
MGFWDRLRRGKAAAQEPVDARVTAPTPPARPAWDGGWRALPPLDGVVRRSSVAVGDGLRFRDGLTSWRDHRLGGELGHSVSASAPSGLIAGVTGPEVSERSRYSGGGPLLVAWGRDTAGGVAGASGDAGGSGSATPPVVQRSAAPGAAKRSGGRGAEPGSTPPAARSLPTGVPADSRSSHHDGAAVGAETSGGEPILGSAGFGGVRAAEPLGTGAAGVVRLRPVRPP